MSTMMTEAEIVAEEEKRNDNIRAGLGILEMSPESLRRVRHDFNPTKNADVARIKMMIAAVMTVAERGREIPREYINPAPDAPPNFPAAERNIRLNDAAREFNIAITHLETACMYMVQATERTIS